LDDQLAQRATGDKFHRIERRTVGPAAGFVDRDDAGMLEAGGDQRFAQEADLADVAARDQFLGNYVAAEFHLLGAQDAAQTGAAMLAKRAIPVGIATSRDRNVARWQRTRLMCALTGPGCRVG